MKILTVPKKLMLQIIDKFRKKDVNISITNSELERIELMHMNNRNKPYHKELEKIIINLSDNLANIKQLYENKTQNEYQDDLQDLENLAKNLKTLFECEMNWHKERYSFEEKLNDANIISEGLSALIQNKEAFPIVHSAKTYSNKRIAKMFHVFLIDYIPEHLLNNNSSVLIVGNSGTGKSSLLNELIKLDLNKKFLLDQDKNNFHEWDKDTYLEDTSLFDNACSKNKNIYLDEVHPELKEELIKKFFEQKDNKSKNKIVVTYQGLEDIKDKRIISKFDVIIFTKRSTSITNTNYKELFYDEDLERLSHLFLWGTGKGYLYSMFNIKKSSISLKVYYESQLLPEMITNKEYQINKCLKCAGIKEDKINYDICDTGKCDVCGDTNELINPYLFENIILKSGYSAKEWWNEVPRIWKQSK